MSPVVILRLRNMTAVDATGLRAMQDFADAIHAENILPNVEVALARATELRRAIA